MLRTTAITVALLVTTGTSANAAAITLISGALGATGGEVTCHVVNAGKKTVDLITVAIVPITQPANASSVNCQQVAPNTACPVTIGLGSPGDYYCKATIAKGNKKDFRATFCDLTSGNCSELR
jgi:hypothetical protein